MHSPRSHLTKVPEENNNDKIVIKFKLGRRQNKKFKLPTLIKKNQKKNPLKQTNKNSNY
jgi:hypothetical protein